MHREIALTPLVSDDDWAAFHSIRKAELFAARGRGEAYDADHPDDRAPGNLPLLLRRDGEAVGVVRIDFLEDGLAVLRLLAIRGDRQGRGLGAELIRRALAEMRARGATRAVVNAASEALPFYERCGFVAGAWPDPYRGELHDGTVQMVLNL